MVASFTFSISTKCAKTMCQMCYNESEISAPHSMIFKYNFVTTCFIYGMVYHIELIIAQRHGQLIYFEYHGFYYFSLENSFKQIKVEKCLKQPTQMK